jgi:hypothetical protein
VTGYIAGRLRARAGFQAGAGRIHKCPAGHPGGWYLISRPGDYPVIYELAAEWARQRSDTARRKGAAGTGADNQARSVS